MEEEKKSNKKKKLISAVALLFVMGFVFAAYSVITTAVTVEVREPFEISYAILGDGSGNWDVENCSDVGISSEAGWVSTDDLTSPLDVGHIYAGEERTLCVKVNNLSEAELPYGIDFLGSLPGAQMVKVDEIINSPVAGQSESISRVDLKVKNDAEPSTTDYTINVEVTRG